MTVEAFMADTKTLLAVERCLEIISEASRDIPEVIRAEHPDIPWRRMADAGNVYRHIYDMVNPEIVWRVVKDDLSKLRTAMIAIAAKHVDPSSYPN